MEFTGYDMFVIGLLLISGVISFARGFLREVLSVAAFITAALASLWGSPPLWAAAGDIIQPAWLAKAVIVVGVFLAVYVGVTMVTSSVTNLVHRSENVGFIDRVIGLIFGVARGLLIAALLLIFANAVLPRDEHPEWLVTAKTYPLVYNTAVALQAVAPATARIAARSLPPQDAQ